MIFSHSSAGGLNGHPRNVPDDVLRLLPANGGVVMVNWVPGFLSPDVWRWDGAALGRGSAAEVDPPRQQGRGRSRASRRGKPPTRAPPSPSPRSPTISSMSRRVAGHDHVGIGADLDGIPYTPTGLEGVETYPRLFAELIRRGWSDANLAKLAGGNVLRALRGAEATAAAMKRRAAARSPGALIVDQRHSTDGGLPLASARTRAHIAAHSRGNIMIDRLPADRARLCLAGAPRPRWPRSPSPPR